MQYVGFYLLVGIVLAGLAMVWALADDPDELPNIKLSTTLISVMFWPFVIAGILLSLLRNAKDIKT